MTDAEKWIKLKRLTGYVGNGSETRVVLFHDDATLSCWIRVGNISHFGRSFDEALSKFEEEE